MDTPTLDELRAFWTWHSEQPCDYFPYPLDRDQPLPTRAELSAWSNEQYRRLLLSHMSGRQAHEL